MVGSNPKFEIWRVANGRLTVFVYADKKVLQEACASAFGLDPASVIGFRSANVVYPITFACRCSAAQFGCSMENPLMLTLHVKLAVASDADFAALGGVRDKEAPKVVFSFALGSTEVGVTESDILKLVEARRKTKLELLAPLAAWKVFSKAAEVESGADGNRLTTRAFKLGVLSLIPRELLSEAEQRKLSGTLYRIFHAFETEGNGASLVEFVIGFGVLLEGNRAEKLRWALEVLGCDLSKGVERADLEVVLRSFLVAVLAFDGDQDQDGGLYLRELAGETVRDLAGAAFGFNPNPNARIEVESLVKWFEESWQENMPWAGLIGLESAQASIGEARARTRARSKARARPFQEGKDQVSETGVEEVRVFQFQLKGGMLVIDEDDVADLEAVVRLSGLGNVSCKDLIEGVAGLGSDNSEEFLGREAFYRGVATVLPNRQNLSPTERAFLEEILSQVFDIFDMQGEGVVQVDEFGTGFAVLCGGNKSAKLATCFEQFDVENTGRLSFLSMMRFLRSYLLALFGLNGRYKFGGFGKEEVYQMADQTAVEAVKCIKEWMEGKGETKRSVSFLDFGGWYNEAGHELVPWLELLDLSKWDFGGEVGGNGNPDKAQEVEEEELDGEQPVFCFSLGKNQPMLSLYRRDVDRLETLLSLSELDGVDCGDIHEVLGRFVEKGALSKESFDLALEDLVNLDELDDEEREFLGALTDHIFYAYDRSGNYSVRAKELISGFSFFGEGSKSDKLNLAFAQFDSDGDGLVDREELARFLRSFLTVLFVMNQDSSDEAAEEIWKVVDLTALDLTDLVFGGGENQYVSFEMFADWYTTGGYRDVPWLELLDLKKWPMEIGLISETENFLQKKAESPESPEENPEENPEEEKDEEDLLFHFRLMDCGKSLRVFGKDVEHAKLLSGGTKMKHMTPNRLYSLLDQASSDGFVDRELFNSSTKFLVSESVPDLKQRLRNDFLSLFDAFDRQGSGKAPLDELYTGLSLLATGSKSNKLALAFNLLDNNEDGLLTRQEFWTFLRSFLCALFGLVFSVGAADQKREMDEFWPTIDDASVELAAKIFLEADRADRDQIEFEEFARWYSAGKGFDVIPWLELLDVKKWSRGEEMVRSESSGMETPKEPDHENELQEEENHTPSSESQDENRNEDEDQDDLVFQFQLTEDGDLLNLKAKDVAKVRAILEKAMLYGVDADEFHRRCHEAADGGQIPEDDIKKVMGPGPELLQLFRCFDREVNAKGTKKTPEKALVRLKEVAAGLSIFCGGSKSDKLVLAFALFDSDLDGMLTHPELARFLRSFLTVLVGLSGVRGEDLWILTDTSALEFADLIMADLGLDLNDETSTLSFTQFADWYTSGGCDQVPWLELLNLAKWPLK